MNIKNIIIICAALALAACSSQDEPWGDKLDAPVAAEFSGNIENVATRASGTSWADGDAIGITGGSYTNIKYVTTAGNGNFSPAAGGIFFQDKQSVNFTAYYPYSENGGTITANTSSQTAADQSGFDFLWAKASASFGSPKAAFTFSHKMTKLILNIKWKVNDSGISKSEFESATFALGGVKLNGSFDTATGEATATGDADGADWAITSSSSSGGNTEITRTFNLILFPQTSNLTVKVAIDGQEYACDISNLKLEAGTSYTYTISVKNKELEVADKATISDWSDGGSDYTGTATPLPDPFNGHRAVKMRNASGDTPALYFAECNIGADEPEDVGLYFWWGDTHGYKATATFDFSANNSEIITYYYTENENKPNNDYLYSKGILTKTADDKYLLSQDYDAASSIWEGEWRMPTLEEFAWLTNSNGSSFDDKPKNCTWEWQASSNGKCAGYKVTSVETGYSIFLPAAGYDKNQKVNTEGYYWTVNPIAQSQMSQSWKIESNDYQYNYGALRYHGYSIRPVLTK